MATINVYEQYFAADLTASGVPRKGALVMLVSASMMGVCALALKKLGWRWMNDYALPISLLVGMLSAIPITALLA